MRFLHRLAGTIRVLSKARRNRTDLHRYLMRRPLLLMAMNGYEAAVLASNRVEPRLKYLASVKTSSLVGCPF
jgi:hypothetical protein